MPPQSFISVLALVLSLLYFCSASALTLLWL